ncbi:LsmAD domain-containing protein [Ganoderma leucocontextum]|nr:LsmAD domain-containing protein [Ganoderma leucocontextum]
MATAARQSKPPRKGPEPARRTNAWTGARASPTYSPSPTPANARLPNGNQQGPSGAFPPLANGARPPAPSAEHTRVLAQISGLTGTTVTITTKNNSRFEGVVTSTSPEGDTTGVTLKDVKEVNNPGAPLRETQFIAATNIQEWTSGPADAKIPNGADSFKTDTDISNTGARRERELQAWQPESADANGAPAPASGPTNSRNVDELTFGPGASGASWDQFAVNEKLFGVKAGFDEDLYTTKLDRNAPDFKEKEKRAQQLANEIMSSTVNNAHVAEERVMNLTSDGSTANEEDKYGAVVRGANAYVPPGARKTTGNPTTPPAKSELPKVAVNAPDGSAVSTSTTTASTPTASKVPSPAPSAAAASKQPADAVPAFRNFVSTEKDRLLKKKQALMRSEMDKRLSDLVSFSKSFKLNKPIPEDLVPILAKDEDKQRAIKEKSTRDAEDTKARSIGVSTTIATAPGVRPIPTQGKAGADTSRAAPVAKPPGASSSGSSMSKTSTAPSKPGDAPKKISMFIQSIPPFKGKRTSAASAPAPAQLQPVTPSTNGAAKPAGSPLSPTAQNRLNVNASSFRPNVKASAFSPGGSSSPNANGATSSTSSNGKQAQSENASPQGPPNPFFGTRVIKKTPPVHVKDDFNPFKHHKVIESAQVGACCSPSRPSSVPA